MENKYDLGYGQEQSLCVDPKDYQLKQINTGQVYPVSPDLA